MFTAFSEWAGMAASLTVQLVIWLNLIKVVNKRYVKFWGIKRLNV